MVQVMLAEKERREAEQMEERRRWELERQLREEALLEERRRREEEMAHREEQTRMQMQVLQSLVQGIQLQGEAATKRAENERDVKVPKLTEKDDIVSYLTMFERLMLAYEVKKDKWVFKLAAHLAGKAQEAYAALPTEDAKDYEKVKEAILQRYDITEECYRQRFRAAKRKGEESNREFLARLTDFAEKWLQAYGTREKLLDQVILEQFLKTLPDDVRVFVKERHPTTSKEASKLSDDYVQAHKDGAESQKKDGDKSGRRCLQCGKLGHVAKDCWRQSKPQGQRKGQTVSKHPKNDLTDIECFNCHKKGHYSSNCPHNAMICTTERRVDHNGSSPAVKKQTRARLGSVRHGFVEKKSVKEIVLDSGCYRTVVHRDLVPEGKIKEGVSVAIRCAHGDTVLYPVADISIDVEGKHIDVEAAVSDTLPVDVLLGTDVEELKELLVGSQRKPVEAFSVTTRSALRKQNQATKEQAEREKACGIQPHTLEEDSHEESDILICETQSSESGGEGESSSCAGAPDQEVDFSGAEDSDAKCREGESSDTSNYEVQSSIAEEDGHHEGELEEEDMGLDKLEDELFEGGREKRRQTRSEKHEERFQRGRQKSLDGTDETGNEAKGDANQGQELDLSPEEMKRLQESDSSLESIRKIVDQKESKSGIGFFRENGLLYRRWVPKGRDAETMSVEQLVLPQKCRIPVMKLAHSIPLAGHLGKNKTTSRVLQRFYWPTMYKDIARYCRGCASCQLATGRKPKQVPLIPLPVISQPFSRIAMGHCGSPTKE